MIVNTNFLPKGVKLPYAINVDNPEATIGVFGDSFAQLSEFENHPNVKNFDHESSWIYFLSNILNMNCETFGISQYNVKVKHPADPTEEVMPEPSKEPKLDDSEYKDDPAKGVAPAVGDEFNMSLFKELMKSRTESERPSTGPGKVVEMGKGNDTSPIVPNKK